MSQSPAVDTVQSLGRMIRVYGLVQGVGFRPFVWQLAKELDISGKVLNDSSGVLIEAWGSQENLDRFLESIGKNNLPLARVERIEAIPFDGRVPSEFSIVNSVAIDANTSVAAEAATCDLCLEDTFNPLSRRYRYPFNNCTHCGPRLSIIKSIPYDRQNTSMAVFALCADCQKEYEDPADRRYHAQATACPKCGPKLKLRRSDNQAVCTESFTHEDELDAVVSLILKGEILAIKGLGGFQLCCDATNHDAVTRLRQRKRRFDKPFALMGKDLDEIKRYCLVSDEEAELLNSICAPIVLLEALPNHNLSASVAPGVSTLGFMLPNTPLHHMIMASVNRPVVFSSGNLSDEPQSIDNGDALSRLGQIADYILEHNRDIVNRVDDSVMRVSAKAARMIRRARGYAPAPVSLPPGFSAASASGILAMGAELKNTLCFVKGASAFLTQHIGDLGDALTFEDYKKNLSLYQNLFQHRPEKIVVDRHPEYLSTKLGKQLAAQGKLELYEVQHHHAHLAACLAENNWALDGDSVLGVALDGLGFGDDGFWGGEFMECNYRTYERLGTFKPVALIGGSQAMLEPWRNTYAHIIAGMGWQQYVMSFKQLELTDFFESKPINVMAAMLKSDTNVPLASSCGRLFDAVAAAIGICRERASYEGQAAIELESIVDKRELNDCDDSLAYPFSIPRLTGNGIPYIEPLEMWQALLRNLTLNTPKGVMAARFHKGLAQAVVAMIRELSNTDGERRINTIALSGGVFQNKILLEQVVERLENYQYKVLTHSKFPSNDGSVALGQALICAARSNKNN